MLQHCEIIMRLPIWVILVLISWPTFLLLYPALCLECDNGSYLTADSLSVVSYAPVHSVPCHGIARTANWLARRATIAKYTRCRWPNLTCLSMDVCDCVRYKNTLKHFIRLCNSSESVTARFATWNPGNWHENQIEIRSKTLVNPWNIARTRRTGSLVVSRGVLYFDYRTHVPR